MPRKNLTPLRRADLPHRKRRKTSVRRLNREAKETVAVEQTLLKDLLRDVLVRAHLRELCKLPHEPLSVWTELDTFGIPAETSYRDLQPWENLTRWMKAQAGFFAGLEYRATHTFNANIHPDLERRWAENQMEASKQIQQRLGRELKRAGLHALPYFYSIEGRSKGGRGRSKLHIHGYCVTENIMDVTRLKLALERAFRMNELSRIERLRGVRNDVGYYPPFEKANLGAWVGYSMKNVSKRDTRATARRDFMSKPLTQLARSFWELVVEAHAVSQT